MKLKRIFIIIALLWSVLLVGCAEMTELVIIEEIQEPMPTVEPIAAETEAPVDEDLDGRLGSYAHSGEPPGEEINNGYISMDLRICSENERYLGYLNIDSNRLVAGKSFESFERYFVEVRGTQDQIDVIFAENLLDEGKQGNASVVYQKGDILFSFQSKKAGIKTIWQAMQPNEETEDFERGFVHRKDPDDWISVQLKNEKDQSGFLRAFGITAETAPIYQYYDENGALQLTLYHDENSPSGVGIFYANRDGKIVFITGFDIDTYQHEQWKEETIKEIKSTHDTSEFAGYSEKPEYNEAGQMTRFYSECIIEGYKGSPYIDTAIELEFFYREDGTLERKECYYNSRLFGTSRQNETYYYDTAERLVYVDSYITHGYLEDYYIYDGDGKIPSYRLTLDHFGADVYADLTKYETTVSE